ncbi:hemoglobin [Microbacterium sp. cf046]|uniref:globin domain-containing protein n=1 Tax=Microbacterium sp. cf046 TaxID=1761803 RepID=UPI0008F12044|nr:oxidoreductase [Microbacterium sp. cf046]SFR90141.1 hemoglobin [Microbacterium sp. cf046]
MDVTVYEALGGRARVVELASAWHERCLADEIMNHPFSHGGDPHHIDRLAAYWSEQLGGPPLYTSGFADESFVVRMHSGNGVHEEMDQRAVACFVQALDDIGVTEATLRDELIRWFTHETAEMSRYPHSPADVPDDLPLPVWPGRVASL